ncbi:PAQR family membrane homeostasis protein TrhA [Nitrospirillum viridazoti]|uniref:DNA-binding protein n=1 Tax=Nitrospirillum viridazoti CBAmc TaxID=1441467 RepID=A0A248K348_9PROT|nr:hemolysin III family protein [Nitrospirillum amazonense]ASG25219.1 DNA-binding protein [Nitrospirillum amazonense CBAmc]
MDTHPDHLRCPVYSRREYAADAVVHLLGVTAGWLGGIWLVLSRSGSLGTGSLTAVAIYALAMAGMFTASAAYNVMGGGWLKDYLRRLDHAVIYAAIAGTYTPLLTRLPGVTAAIALGIVWGVAMAGILLKLWRPRRHERLGLILYVCLGWVGLPLIPALSGRLLADTGLWIGAGALTYTLGVGVYLAHRVRYHNVLWHLMVLVAASFHYVAIGNEFP